jgi:hypothetical protein
MRLCAPHPFVSVQTPGLDVARKYPLFLKVSGSWTEIRRRFLLGNCDDPRSRHRHGGRCALGGSAGGPPHKVPTRRVRRAGEPCPPDIGARYEWVRRSRGPVTGRPDKPPIGRVPFDPHVQRGCHPAGRLGTSAPQHRDRPPRSLCSRRSGSIDPCAPAVLDLEQALVFLTELQVPRQPRPCR